MSGPPPSSPHTDEFDDSPTRFRDGKLLVFALAAIVAVVGVVLYLSWSGLHAASDGPDLHSSGDPIDGRTSVPVESLPALPPLSTVTATSQVPTEIGGTSSTRSPSSTSSSSDVPSTSSRMSSTSSATPTDRPTVKYQVVSDSKAVINYRSASGKAWNYSMPPGTWAITAPGGGQVQAHTVSGTGEISCRTQTERGGAISEDRRVGSVVCAG